jgi:hypothetical protein
VKSETVISKHLLWPFRSYIWRSVFKHNSNGICHSAHNSFLAVLVSNGTSENRRWQVLSLKETTNASRPKKKEKESSPEYNKYF